MVMKNAMNHKHSRGASFLATLLLIFGWRKFRRRVGSIRPGRQAVRQWPLFAHPCQLEVIAEGPETALLRYRLPGV